MAQAIVIRAHGGPEVLQYEEVSVPAPGAGELRLRQTCLGVNFHDIYVRSGDYRTLALPGIPGIEGVGVVTDVGTGVSGFAPGDRVAYVTRHYGCYASERLLPAARAIRLPDTLDDLTAGGLLLKGLTVDMLVHRVCRLEPGQTILVHAAAGGVGQLLVQWACALGVRVIGTAGSASKAEIARAAGCEAVILYREEDVAQRVMALTGGRGVDVVYDGVGRDTFAGSLASLAPCSHLVNFGQASGSVAPVPLSDLAARSATLSRPVVFHYMEDASRAAAMAGSLFQALARGWLRPPVPDTYALRDAAAAHRALESRSATRPIVLIP